MLDTLINHKTVRKYRSEQIPTDIFTKIIEASIRASTTGNMQLYSIINTTSLELKQKLAPVHFNQKMIFDAPNVLTFCADFNRFKKWCILSNAEAGYDNFLSFITAAIDALLVAQNVAIAAEDYGLGICYLGTTIYNADKIIDILNLPIGVVPITTLTIGWPDENPSQVDRLPLNAVLHQEIYSNYTSEEIAEIYHVKEHLETNRQFVIENKKETLAQVFTDIRYKKTDNEFFSKKLLDMLRQQGFLD